MITRKGFTLIELLIVMVIVGILVAMAIPSYRKFIYMGEARAAYHNLQIIAYAEKEYYITHRSYYPPLFATHNLTDINTQLSLNIPANNDFVYALTPTLGGIVNNIWCELDSNIDGGYVWITVSPSRINPPGCSSNFRNVLPTICP